MTIGCLDLHMMSTDIMSNDHLSLSEYEYGGFKTLLNLVHSKWPKVSSECNRVKRSHLQALILLDNGYISMSFRLSSDFFWAAGRRGGGVCWEG